MRDATRRGILGAIGGEDWQEPLAELGLPLEELVRRGARDILRRTIEAEVQAQLDECAPVALIDGRWVVVRNGYLPTREILTTMRPVEVQVPKVRDRSGSGVKFNSALAPPYLRRSARVAAALPWQRKSAWPHSGPKGHTPDLRIAPNQYREHLLAPYAAT